MAAGSNQLRRSISLSNMEHVGKIRQSIARDRKQGPEQAVCYFDVFTAFSFHLPMSSLEGDSPEFCGHLLSGIQDQGMQRRLEEEGAINWTSKCLQLYCLWTKGDGNCLMHAASLAMWGIHDSNLILRSAVYDAMVGGTGSTLYRRWVQARRKEMHQFDASLDRTQIEREWTKVVEMCNPLHGDGRMESLEEFHIFVLANVLRRPIIVYGLPKVRSYASGGTLAPCSIPGIYLPLLWTPDCVAKNPICLGYAGSHFTALVPDDVYDTRYRPAFPLCTRSGTALPVHFLLEEEYDIVRNYKEDYMMLEKYPGEHGSAFEATQVSIRDQPEFLKKFWSNYVRQCRVSCASHKGIGYGGQTDQRSRLGSSGSSQEVQRCPICNSPGGGPDKSFLCSACYSEQLQAAAGPSATAARPPRADHIIEEGQDPSLPPPRTILPQNKCKTPSCDLYGSAQNEGYCSKCYKDILTTRRASSSQSSQQWENPRPGLCQQCNKFDGVPVLGGLCTGCHTRNIHPRDLPSSAGSSVIGYQQEANMGGEGRTKQCTYPGCTKVRDPSSDYFCFDHFAQHLSNPSAPPGGIKRCTYENCTKTVDPSAKLLCYDHLMLGLEGHLPGFDMSLIQKAQSRQSVHDPPPRQQAVKTGGGGAGFDNGDDLPPPLAVRRPDPAAHQGRLDYHGHPEGRAGPTPHPRSKHLGLEIDRLNIAGNVPEPSKLKCFMCQGMEPTDNPAGVVVCSDHAREMHEICTGVLRRLPRESGKCCLLYVGGCVGARLYSMRKMAATRQGAIACCDMPYCDALYMFVTRRSWLQSGWAE